MTVPWKTNLATACYFLIPLLALGLFINKPFHVDDASFLLIGRITPYSLLTEETFTLPFLGQRFEQQSPYETTHPPFIPLVLKTVDYFQDVYASTWLYHLVFAFFSLLFLRLGLQAATTFYFWKGWVWLLFFSPVLFIAATNLMTDMATLTFWVGSLLYYYLYLLKRQRRLGFTAAAYLLLALATAYQSLGLVLLQATMSLMLPIENKNPKFKPGALWPIALPLGLWLAFYWAVFRFSGFIPYWRSANAYNIAAFVSDGLVLGLLAEKAISSFVYLGFGGIALFLLALLKADRIRLWRLLLTTLATHLMFTLASSQDLIDDYSLLASFFVKFFTFSGLYLFSFAVEALWRFLLGQGEKQRFILSLWAGGVFFYCIFLLPNGAARYALPAYPAVFALVLAYPGRTGKEEKDETTPARFFKAGIPGYQAAALLVSTTLLSLFAAAVDMHLAKADLTLAKIIHKHGIPFTKVVYSDDGPLKTYLGDRGARYLTRQEKDVLPGDFVLITRGWIAEPVLAGLDGIHQFNFPGFAGWTTFTTKANAGFYHSSDGLLPLAPASIAKQAVWGHFNPLLAYPATHHLARPQGSMIKQTSASGSQETACLIPPGGMTGLRFPDLNGVHLTVQTKVQGSEEKPDTRLLISQKGKVVTRAAPNGQGQIEVVLPKGSCTLWMENNGNAPTLWSGFNALPQR